MEHKSILLMRFIPLFTFLFISTIVQAQFEKLIHQTFEVEEYMQVDLNILGEYKIEKWAGNVILTETKIQLFDASPSIFNFYLDEKRYDIVSEVTDTALLIKSFDTERKQIRTKTGECYEIIEITLFVPDDFEIEKNIRLTRKSNEKPAVSTDALEDQ